MNTGENQQALQKIIDFIQLMSVVLLLLHFYAYCHPSLTKHNATVGVMETVIIHISRTGIFNNILANKAIIAGMLVLSMIGSVGKRSGNVKLSWAITACIAGLSVFLFNHYLIKPYRSDTFAISYFIITTLAYLALLAGGTWLSRYIQVTIGRDIFNELNESFPQEERLLQNEYSINLPAVYKLKGKARKSWINIINPFRSLLVIGTPGAGKSYFVIRHIITQHLQKGFTMFVYDFKYDDLSRIAYNTLRRYARKFPILPKFYVINFEDLSRTHRCNPLDPATMDDITDATESSRTIMLGLNRDWIKKQGDFFVESPINFVTAIIWFLRKYQDGRYCTLPHVIELMQLDYPNLFKLLRTEPEIEVLINPFESAFRNEAMEQLEGQIASAKIGMARLSSPQLYYVLSGNDLTLDINNPDKPKIVCVGNNPQKQQIYGAVLSLYISRVIKLVNKKKQQKCSLIFDEFPTIYFNGIDSLIATARANKVATCLAVQDYSQLKKDYGREQAEVIMNIVGNVISGQVVGETAKLLSERFGKIVQERESLSINRADTSISKSSQLDSAIPASKIASLSSGEFVGTVADDPDQKIKLKSFHCEIINDHDELRKEELAFKPIPVIRNITPYEIQQNYYRIKEDIQHIVDSKLHGS